MCLLDTNVPTFPPFVTKFSDERWTDGRTYMRTVDGYFVCYFVVICNVPNKILYTKEVNGINRIYHYLFER